ncbi:formate dehydrogenase subunit gamma [Desulfosporosinus sp.]|uniref:formate dehydrogenase subunit gamma n=1 Tax=Desulfosporosinus sp. TaxID=157907 RepID=UPI000E834BB6|nr:cytochrome b/b6 domain-containing protein [Desulfosporosinus sp.]MBC2721897.1 cytochrome b/b6 domain-containing protein [Desulfosporosinus sp.]MBC2727174.1 cytochrome b/b6 domain-containing protein [Desulfosporosinus sp.]HBV88218.1 cytochrome B [Desulfosporosinus sp.]
METEHVFQRFDLHQRIQHIGMFTSFIVLTITGLPIKFEQSSISQGVVSLFGGFDNMLFVHLVAAAVMLLSFVYHLLYLVIQPIVTKKLSLAILPSGKDFVDVIHDVKYLLGLRKDPPKFDRYTYKEKFDYWAVFWGMAIMGGSGLMMWFPQIFTQYMPIWVIDSARYAHTDEAMLAISAIFIWHFFNSHFSPRFFPMNHVWYRGTISREEMKEDHPLELERLEREDKGSGKDTIKGE